jgi:hypothetical protein
MTLMQSSFRLGKRSGKRNRQWRGSRAGTPTLADIDGGVFEPVVRPARQARSERLFWTSMPNAAGKPLDLAFCCFPPASPAFASGTGKQKRPRRASNRGKSVGAA